MMFFCLIRLFSLSEYRRAEETRSAAKRSLCFTFVQVFQRRSTCLIIKELFVVSRTLAET